MRGHGRLIGNIPSVSQWHGMIVVNDGVEQGVRGSFDRAGRLSASASEELHAI